MSSDRKKILLLTDWYYPGYKAGGPIQSCINLVRELGYMYDFYILTGDRDLGSVAPYEDIPVNEWMTGISGEKVFYLKESCLSRSVFYQILKEVQPSVVYLNNMFSIHFALKPYWWLRRGSYAGKLVWAPRGMLHPGALQLKGGKKKLFLSLMRLIGLPAGIVFQATSLEEFNDIRHQFPGTQIIQAENIPRSPLEKPIVPVKLAGELKMVFISRLHPKKNLSFLLELLKADWGNNRLELDVYGDAESVAYDLECRALANALGDQVIVRFLGPVENNLVFETLLPYHVFVLPSLGENFGHAIFEALACGKPVLLSDQTPWRNLEDQRAGWDIPLTSPHQFKEALLKAVQMNQAEYNVWSYAAGKLAHQYIKEAGFELKYKELFT